MIRVGIGVQGFVSGGVSNDADAQAFIDAAGITDATQQSAINTLVTDLKGYSIWTKMKAIYPFVGGSSSSHKYNLRDPRDLDAAFRLVFSGGGTHASTGWTPNGVNGYANTFLAPNTYLGLNNAALSYYSRTTGFSNSIIGASSTLTNAILIAPRFSSGAIEDYSAINCSTTGKTAASNTLGFFIISRILSSSFRGFRNGSQYFNSNETSNSLTSQNIFIGARNMGGSANQFSNLQCAFASIGDGLTDTEAANFYTAVQAFQTTLSRNV